MILPATDKKALYINVNKSLWKPWCEYLNKIIIISNNNNKHLKNIENVISSFFAAETLLELKTAPDLQQKWKTQSTL